MSLSSILSVILLLTCMHGNASFNRDENQYHRKTYNYNATEHFHRKPWLALEEVDGLRNEDVVMMVTSTGSFEFKFLRER